MALPHVRQPVSGDAPVTRPWYQWFQRIDAAIDSSGTASAETDANVTLILNALGSTDGTAAGLPTPLFDFGSAGSISAVRNGSNAWFLSLAGDAQNPGNTYYYGTGDTGTKGWFDLRAAITIYSDTAPDGHAGLKWVDTTTGIKYDWYVDADGGQWVEFGPESGTGGGGYPEGTVFPVSPLTGDKFYRTDLNLLCYFDGTRWLTCQMFTSSYSNTANATNNPTSAARFVLHHLQQVYVEKLDASAYVMTTNTGSAYWNFDMGYVDAANAITSIATANTSASAPNVWTRYDLTPSNKVIPTTAININVAASKTGSPGALLYNSTLYYRLIVT